MKSAVGSIPGGPDALFEAYQDLYALSQLTEKPYHAPAVLVVGHQGDRKSALIDALMGFPFHQQVGDELRRPITLHMKCNRTCDQPICFLTLDDGSESEISLDDLQSYLAAENARLEAVQSFWSKEVVVRVEYQRCPNITLISVPDLITPSSGAQRFATAHVSQQVEAITRAKLEQKELIIVCVDGSNSWDESPLRKLAMQVDPLMNRTILVSSRLDSRLSDLSASSDVEALLHPSGVEPTAVDSLAFLVSVDSIVYNDQFSKAVTEREAQDMSELEAILGRRLDRLERGHVGVTPLRRFLEAQLLKRYMDTLPSVAPLLDQEMRNIQDSLDGVNGEIDTLTADELKTRARKIAEGFLSRLLLLMRGSAIASPDLFGETLSDEHICGGVFSAGAGRQLEVLSALPNAHIRLLGGAQFHRAMAEFRLAVGGIQCPDITREEIANACGLEDFHDGVNYMRTACILAVTKAQSMFKPFLQQLGFRLSHILRRLLPVVLQLMQKDDEMLCAGHEALFQRFQSEFYGFMQKGEKSCYSRCIDDLQSTTRFVTWSLHNNSQRDVKTVLSKVHGIGASADEGKAIGVVSMINVLEDTLWKRQLTSTSEEIVGALVAQTFNGIRDYIVQAAELKFNCFFLMELFETFPSRLRVSIEDAFGTGAELFDVEVLRNVCEAKMQDLELELEQVQKLQRTFSGIFSSHTQFAHLSVTRSPTRLQSNATAALKTPMHAPGTHSATSTAVMPGSKERVAHGSEAISRAAAATTPSPSMAPSSRERPALGSDMFSKVPPNSRRLLSPATATSVTRPLGSNSSTPPYPAATATAAAAAAAGTAAERPEAASAPRMLTSRIPSRIAEADSGSPSPIKDLDNMSAFSSDYTGVKESNSVRVDMNPAYEENTDGGVTGKGAGGRAPKYY